MIDLSKLTPNEKLNLFLCDLAVKQKMGWHTEKCTDSDQWFVPNLFNFVLGILDADTKEACIEACYQNGHDVGLLTKAYEWWKANIEAKEPTVKIEMMGHTHGPE